MFLLALIPPQMIGNLSKLHPKELKFTSISGGIKVNFSSPSGLTVACTVHYSHSSDVLGIANCLSRHKYQNRSEYGLCHFLSTLPPFSNYFLIIF